MVKLTCRQLADVFRKVSVRREGPLTVKVHSWSDTAHWWLFDMNALMQYRVHIAEMLRQLPAEMMLSNGGVGRPWFAANKRRDLVLWGDLTDVDKLLAMGRALSLVKSFHPLPMCDATYCMVDDQEACRIIRESKKLQKS